MIWTIMILVMIKSFILGYFVGWIRERYQWNELIELGILPKPSKRKFN